MVPASVETVAEDDGEFKIIKNKSFAMHPMTAEEAILQMNLLILFHSGHQKFFSTNLRAK